MSEKKRMNNRIVLVLGLIITMILSGMQLAFAEGGDLMSGLTQDSSTLAIKAEYTDDDDVTTLISGLELSVYKVADLSVKGGSAKYAPCGEFKAIEVDYDGMLASESMDAAAKMYALVRSKNLTGKAATTGSNGVADFGSLPNGMYLVIQTKASGEAQKYAKIQPYLVSLPTGIPGANGAEGTWNYNVESIPKMGIDKKPYIKVTKTSEIPSGKIGDEVPYTITVMNLGGKDVEDVCVVDTLPEGLDYVSDELGGEVKGKKVRWKIDIKVGEVKTIGLIARINEIAHPGNILNTVLVEGVEGEYEPSEDEAHLVLGEYKEDKTTTRTRGVSTGDYTTIGIFAAALAIALAAVILIIIRRRRKSEE